MSSDSIHEPKREFMHAAIAQAELSKQAGDYAIGAIVVMNNEVLAASGNRIKLECDPTQHAEIAAIRLACASTGKRHLEGAILYTTAEPCPMCAAATIFARMAGIVSGSTIEDMAAFRATFGNSEWSWRTVDIAARAVLKSGDPKPFHVEGFLREECKRLFHSA